MFLKLRAGRVNREPITDGENGEEKGFKLVPDPAKGLLWVWSDGLSNVHFCFFSRETTNGIGHEQAEDELNESEALWKTKVLPAGGTFEETSPGSRVFVLKTYCLEKVEEEAYFFWSQEPNPEKDQEAINAIRKAINRFAEDKRESDKDVMESKPMHIGRIHLKTVLDNIMTGSGGEIQARVRAGFPDQWIEPNRNLFKALSPSRIRMLVQSPRIAKELASHLPEELGHPSQIVKMASSPQFKHQVGIISDALSHGVLNSTHFGLRNKQFGIKGFFRAILAELDIERREKGEKKQRKF